MTFRATTATQFAALQQAMQTAAWLKQTSNNWVITLSTQTVSAAYIFDIFDSLKSTKDILTSDASVPGIGAYAQAQFSDPAYDVAAEFTTMMSAINSAISWIVTNFPKDAQGFAQDQKLNADGTRTISSFTSAQTSGLQTALASVANSIS